MRIENPLCDSIRRRKRKSVTPQFAECNSFVNLWTAGGRLQNARYLLAPIGGLLFGRETEVASEVWVRQMNKRAEPIVETGQAAFNCRGQPSQLVVSACQSAFRPRRRSACCTVDRWESFSRFARRLRHTLRDHERNSIMLISHYEHDGVGHSLGLLPLAIRKRRPRLRNRGTHGDGGSNVFAKSRGRELRERA